MNIVYLAVLYGILFLILFPLCIGISKCVPTELIVMVNTILGVISAAAVIIMAYQSKFYILLAFVVSLAYIPNLVLYFKFRKKEKKKYSFKTHIIKTAIISACYTLTMYISLISIVILY